MNHSGSGTILTFYSYKGGTGRSMTLVNFACWLARRSAGASRVLLIDWDLEAPGLQRFFPETEARVGAEQDGLINYFESIRSGLEADPALYERIASDGAEVLRAAFPLDRYLMRDVIPSVDLLRAGRFDADYARMVSSFNWIQFHEKYLQVFPALRQMMTSDYRYCLIDSRTGFNDVSGVCTMLMAEKLVLVFTPNRQSLSGVLDLAARAVKYRRSSDDFRPLAVFPLPSRIENAELDLKQQWRRRYQEEFEATLARIYELDVCNLGAYFDDVVLPHVSYYSYGEEIAVLRESSSDALSLSKAYETFFRRLDEMEFAWDSRTDSPAPPVAAAGYTAADLASDNIFISYAHIDDRALSEATRGWVTTFHRMLQVRLTQLIGREVHIWRDPKLAGNDMFSDELTEAIVKASIFVAIVSPAYVRSRWCQQELQAFLTRNKTANVPHGARVFKLLKAPVRRDEQPEELRALLGYEFFQLDPVTGRVREWSDQEGDFFLRLDDVAHDIAAVMGGEGVAGAAPAASTGVYVAETSSDVAIERDIVRKDLLARGYRVLPDSPLPLEAGALQNAIREQLARCRMSVHLIGRHYGLVPEGDDRSILELQFDLAGERAAADSSFRRMVWKPANLEVSTDKQRAFVASLRSQNRRDTDLLEVSIEELKGMLSSAAQPKPVPQAAAATARASVYLIFDRRDEDAAGVVSDFLFGRGLEVILPIWEGDETDIRLYHEESLATCDAVLIYYGAANELWLRRQLRVMMKIKGFHSVVKPQQAAVLLAPPDSAAKRQFRTHEMQVLDAMATPIEEALKPFVDAVSHV